MRVGVCENEGAVRFYIALYRVVMRTISINGMQVSIGWFLCEFYQQTTPLVCLPQHTHAHTRAAMLMMLQRRTNARWNTPIIAVLLLAFGSYLCTAEDRFSEHPQRDESHQDDTAGAITMWIEDQYVWIASHFWSNVFQVMFGGYIALAVLLYVRRRYRLAHERRWNKFHVS